MDNYYSIDAIEARRMETEQDDLESTISDISYSVLTCCHCHANETETGFVLDKGKHVCERCIEQEWADYDGFYSAWCEIAKPNSKLVRFINQHVRRQHRAPSWRRIEKLIALYNTNDNSSNLEWRLL